MDVKKEYILITDESNNDEVESTQSNHLLNQNDFSQRMNEKLNNPSDDTNLNDLQSLDEKL